MIGSTASLPLHSAVLQLRQNLSGHQTWNIQAISMVCALQVSLVYPTILPAVLNISLIHPYFNIKPARGKSYLPSTAIQLSCVLHGPSCSTHVGGHNTVPLSVLRLCYTCKDAWHLRHPQWRNGITVSQIFLKIYVALHLQVLTTSKEAELPAEGAVSLGCRQCIRSWELVNMHFHHHHNLKYRFQLQF